VWQMIAKVDVWQIGAEVGAVAELEAIGESVC
jgi:hypothetical protein